MINVALENNLPSHGTHLLGYLLSQILEFAILGLLCKRKPHVRIKLTVQPNAAII